jgi:hypothetical protein
MSRINRNGKAYDSGEVKVQINGVPIEVTKISYANEQEHQLNYSLGNTPTSWSMGKVTPSASIGIAMHHITPLEVASGGSILNLKPFVITVEFVNDFNLIIVDRIVAKFKNEGREVTGDMGLEKEYELFALEVNLNVTN